MDTTVKKNAPSKKVAEPKETAAAQTKPTVAASKEVTLNECVLQAFPQCIRMGGANTADVVADHAVTLGTALYNRLKK